MARRILTTLLLSGLLCQMAVADPITYRQLRQDAGAAFSRLPAAPALNTDDPSTKGRGPGQPSQQSNPVVTAEESPNHPEFVRLPDGRIVKYGPGVICDEGCVEAVPLGRARVSRNWYALPPLLAAGILCAVLCRGGSDALAAQPPLVLQPSPSPTVTQPTPTPPSEVPEPGTLLLLGAGLGTLLARRKFLNTPAE